MSQTSLTSVTPCSTQDLNDPGTEEDTSFQQQLPFSDTAAASLTEPDSNWWSQGQQTHKDFLKRAGLAPTQTVSTIGFLGQSRNGCLSQTESIVNAVIGQNAFSLSANAPLSVKLIEGDASNEGLYMFVDKKRHIVYLHIVAPPNGEILASACTRAMEEIKVKGFNPWLWKHQYWYIRAALFVFLMSNIVVISHPTPFLDTLTTSLLHTLAVVKRHIGPHLSSFVRGCWKRWKMDPPSYAPWTIPSSERRAGGNAAAAFGSLTPGRCIPVVLFIFQEVPIPSLPEFEENAISKDMKISPYFRIQAAIESRIRFVFRACHIIQSSDLHAPFDCQQLFVLPAPASIPFVHLVPIGASNVIEDSSDKENMPRPPFCIDAVSAMLSSLNFDDAPEGADHMGGNSFTDSMVERRTPNFTERHEVRSKPDGIQLLRESIFACVKLLTKSGNPVTDTTGGRQYSGSTTRSEKNLVLNIGSKDTLPSMELWMSGAVALRRLLYEYDTPIDTEGAEEEYSGSRGNAEKKNIEKPESILGNMLDRKTRAFFEETLTRKLEIVSKPESIFFEDHCRRSLRKAVNVYLLDLPAHYTSKYHQMKLDHAIRLYRSLARGSCAESFISKIENECKRSWMNGRRRCERVSLTGHECALPFGHQNPVVDESDDKNDSPRSKRSARGKERENDGNITKGIAVSAEACSTQYQALHACNCGQSRRERIDPFNLLDANHSFFQQCYCCANESANSNSLHPPHSSAETPMFSILKVGPGSAYRPLRVEKQDGFIPGTSMLLPWDDPLKNGEKANVESKNESKQRAKSTEALAETRKPGVKSKNTTTQMNTSKVCKNQTAYIGLEYECPLGHRYMSRGDGRPSVSGNKDSAELLIVHDQPIFCACPCNASNSNAGASVIAQLQRVVIVTPDSDAILELDAVVKILRLETAEDGENVLSSHELPLGGKFRLPRDSKIVLRLPYIYYDEHGEALPASTAHQTKFTLRRDFVTLSYSDLPFDSIETTSMSYK